MTQYELIVDYIQRNGSITQFEATEHLGITKLATRVSEMRRDGILIDDEYIDTVNRFGRPVRFKRYFMG